MSIARKNSVLVACANYLDSGHSVQDARDAGYSSKVIWEAVHRVCKRKVRFLPAGSYRCKGCGAVVIGKEGCIRCRTVAWMEVGGK